MTNAHQTNMSKAKSALDPNKSYKELYAETIGRKYGLAPWPVEQAKDNFDEMLKMTLTKGSQIITRKGKKIAVMIDYETYTKLPRAKQS